MPWNGSGVFNRIFSWVADKNAALDIIASRMDTDTNDIVANGLGNCITRDGQGQPIASIIPNTTNAYDLGSVSFTWRNGYFGGTLAVTGHTTFEGVTSTGATGTGNLVFSASPTFTGTMHGVSAIWSTEVAINTTLGGNAGSAGFAVLWGQAAQPAIEGYNNASTGEAFRARVDNTNSPLMNLFFATTQVGSISTSTTNAAYNTSSDQRLKNNIQDAGDTGAIIDALRVRSWDWKINDSHEPFGFVAQEEFEIAPFAVTVGDNNPDTIERQWQRDDSKLVPLLVREIQSMRKRLEALERA